MAKLSKINKNNQRIELVKKYNARRIELKKIILDPKTSFEDKEKAHKQLQNLPKDSNPIRVRSRCALTGRPRAVYKKFGLCRIKFRELANLGLIPGVTKASW